MKNAAIYMRVNRNLDIRNQELEEYLNACDNLVKAHPDWRLTETYVDVGLGRKAKKCDEKLLEMLDAAYSGKIEVIIIPSILSFTRNSNDTLSIIRKLKEKGVD
ncbi:MAG: recombinase family protein, partial [Clostridia bacterium]|nr:recombinase family protein [Clostridia bacterium]